MGCPGRVLVRSPGACRQVHGLFLCWQCVQPNLALLAGAKGSVPEWMVLLMAVVGRGLFRPWIVRWPNLPAGTRSIGAGVAQSVCAVLECCRCCSLLWGVGTR